MQYSKVEHLVQSLSFLSWVMMTHYKPSLNLSFSVKWGYWSVAPHSVALGLSTIAHIKHLALSCALCLLSKTCSYCTSMSSFFWNTVSEGWLLVRGNIRHEKNSQSKSMGPCGARILGSTSSLSTELDLGSQPAGRHGQMTQWWSND